MNRASRTAGASALALAACLLLPAGLRAEGPTRISGTVLSDDGKPMAGALLTVTSPGGLPVHVVSDAHGAFLLLGLDPGETELVIEKAKYDGCLSHFQLESGEDLEVRYQLNKSLITISVPPHRPACLRRSYRTEPYDRYVIH